MDELDHFLIGRELSEGWTITAPHETQRDAVSACRAYTARNVDGRDAFVKVLDPRANGSLEEAQQQLEQFIHERHVTDVCASRNMRRVVRGIASGTIKTDPPFSMTIHYLVLEWGPHDVRSFLHPDEQVHLATTLRWLHHTATAIGELHYSEIVHQDIRPANVVVMPNKSAKVAGLGHSHSHKAPRADSTATRDRTYLAPESLYGGRPMSLDDRLAADLYAFGSLCFFLIAGVSLNAEVARRLDPMHHWLNWRGTFPEALPYVTAAFDDVLAGVSADLTWEKSGRLMATIRQLCHPDPGVRGHPANIQGAGARYGMERYISLFDMLASRVEWERRKAS
jgi:serine/threonine protein kinase